VELAIVMMKELRLYPLILGGTAAAALVFGSLLKGNRKTPEQVELERRTRLSNIGRMTDGSVTEVQEFNSNGRDYQVLIYTYDVSGVCYEAGQDVSQLGEYVDLQACRLGLPASIKYDPHDPGNSIVVAEGWSGLRL
jgi:hypothetical protein